MANHHVQSKLRKNLFTQFCSLFILMFFYSCVGSPVQTFDEARNNRVKMINLQIGQDRTQVLNIMGTPYKTESYILQDGKIVDFWLYLTEGRGVDQVLTDANFTPLAFEAGILKGWGRNYYDNVLRIKKDITIENK